MQKAIELIEKLIKEHEDSGYCTNYDDATKEYEAGIVEIECLFDKSFDVGRYETLINLLNDLKKLN